MTAPLPLRIFIASPSDVVNERSVVSACVAEYNARQTAADDTRFEVVGWESVRGTARRPQDAINELINESHYLVALFKQNWGSEPGSPWGYTSGTEEELFNALLQLGQADQPMRDVWVGFVHHDDPATQIQSLRAQMSRQHALLYETVGDLYELKSKFSLRLQGWGATPGVKAARHIDLIPTSGRDLLRAAKLRGDGEKLVELGLPEVGLEKLREAAVLGGPPEQLSYAKMLARRGDLDAAEAAIQSAIDYFSTGPGILNSPLAAEVFAAQAGLLRRQGRDRDAIGRLQHVLTLLQEDDPYSSVVRCRILDELGLAHQKVDEHVEAGRSFREALEIRRRVGDEVGISQSLVNVARSEIATGELESASHHAEEALDRLRNAAPGALLANAEVLRAQVLLRQDSPEDALSSAARAISLNEQLGNRRGVAIAHQVAAQCLRSSGDVRGARDHANESLKLNEEMGNVYGASRSRWLLEQLDA